MSQVSVRRVRFIDVFDDLAALLTKNHEETSSHHGLPLDINVDAFKLADANGILRCFCAYVDDRIVGYAAFLVSEHWHHKGVLYAMQDVIFVDREHRTSLAGIALLRASEDALREEGVTMIVHHQKNKLPALGKLLQFMGYEPEETTWMKRLDRVDQRKQAGA